MRLSIQSTIGPLIKTTGTIALIFSQFAILLFSTCSAPTQHAGGGTFGGNPVVLGKVIVDSTGKGAPNVTLQLMPDSWDPVTDPFLPDSFRNTTDDKGRFSFMISDTGGFNLRGIHNASGFQIFASAIRFDDDTLQLDNDTLKAPGTIVIHLDSLDSKSNGYLYLPGTGLSTDITGSTVTIDSVPAGLLPPVFSRTAPGSTPRQVTDTVIVAPSTITSIPYGGWPRSLRLYLNTTSTGAQVFDTLQEIPILVRLGSDNFPFDEARSDGGDIRFSDAKGASVPYEIERWLSSQKQAEIWVLIDTLLPDNNWQYITMYWGKPDARSQSDGAAVFDTANGFVGVWHLSQSQSGTGGADVYRDATINGYHGTDYVGASSGTGFIGAGVDFNGIDDYIEIPGFPDTDFDTLLICAWVRPDSADRDMGIIAKEDAYVDSGGFALMRNRYNQFIWNAHIDGASRYPQCCFIPEYPHLINNNSGWYFLMARWEGGWSTRLSQGDPDSSHLGLVQIMYAESLGVAPIKGATNSLQFGRMPSDPLNSCFDGSLDEVWILKRDRIQLAQIAFKNHLPNQQLVRFVP